MKLLFDGNNAPVIRNGMPVYLRDDGNEIEFDGAKAFSKIGQLTGENAAQRKRVEELSAKLKPYADANIEDPEAARAAMEKLRNIDDGKLIAAGKVEEIKAEAKKAAQEQVAAAAKAAATREQELSGMLQKRTDELFAHMVGGNFASSKFVAEKCETPPSLLRATFGQNFKVEDGRTVGYDQNGNKIYSIKNPGDLADFDEAIESLVQSHPDRDRILKGSGATGSGARNSGQVNAGKRTITRAQFDALDPVGQRAAATEAAQGKAEIVD